MRFHQRRFCVFDIIFIWYDIFDIFVFDIWNMWYCVWYIRSSPHFQPCRWSLPPPCKKAFCEVHNVNSGAKFPIWIVAHSLQCEQWSKVHNVYNAWLNQMLWDRCWIKYELSVTTSNVYYVFCKMQISWVGRSAATWSMISSMWMLAYCAVTYHS